MQVQLTTLEKLKNYNIDNPYFYLGIKESATTEEIKQAFRDQSRKYNLMGENLQQDGTYVIEILQTAREALLDRDTRQIIDNNLQTQRNAHGLQTMEQAAKCRQEREQAEKARQPQRKTFITEAEADKKRSTQPEHPTVYRANNHQQSQQKITILPTKTSYEKPITDYNKQQVERRKTVIEQPRDEQQPLARYQYQQMQTRDEQQPLAHYQYQQIQTRNYQQPLTNYQYQQPQPMNIVAQQKRTELILPQILNCFNLENSDSLSFADIQLILKEYLKYNWSRYNAESIENGQNVFATNNVYLLLDKKGQLTPVTTQLSEGKLFTRLCHLFSKQVLYNEYGSEIKELKIWNSKIATNECLSTLSSIFPERVAYNETIKQGDIIKGIELGNECLLQLRINGYLKATGNNGKSYIK